MNQPDTIEAIHSPETAGVGLTTKLLQIPEQAVRMSLTTDDFAEFLAEDPEDDTDVPLGTALSELAVDVETDSVEAVRDVRERL
ncbi:Uncharacterized protein AArcS_0334 [Natranaeroarchaeum sulfidigenes]|uniref:Uncharacterized protein n=2 Tax=Natranaeroarchaeum TaxID=2917705 RepID=A0A897MTL6_9EURY|nr:Uncharacterized protein AArcS_0334 [Natranaeroarchaeum sulfidigenes]